MPFGVNVAGDVFQQKLDEIFGKLTQVMCIADDIMVVGYKDNLSNHDLALTKLFQTAQKNNVKLNFEKLQYKKHEVTFFGENYTTQGRKADHRKIKTIVKMKQPENKKEMQTFLGIVQYLLVHTIFVSPSRTTEGPHQNKFTLNLGSRTHYCNECNPRRDGTSTHPKVL